MKTSQKNHKKKMNKTVRMRKESLNLALEDTSDGENITTEKVEEKENTITTTERDILNQENSESINQRKNL